MTRRTRWLAAAGAAVVSGTAGLIGATHAGAAGPGQLPVDATTCTGQTRADAGAVLSGSSSATSGTGPSWSVRVAGAAGGPETEVLRTPARTLPPTAVAPPVSGTWFFRGCVRNTTPVPITVQITLVPS
ncbi:hypothetical protein WEI85_23325 [Actinomycetes bacterium KLBMP 9797]